MSRAERARLATLAAVAVLAGTVGGIVASAAPAARASNHTNHVIEFVIEGEFAAVDHVSVDGHPAETGKAVTAQRFAVVTVRSHDAAPAACTIVVDGRPAVVERGAYGQAITCVWSTP